MRHTFRAVLATAAALTTTAVAVLVATTGPAAADDIDTTSTSPSYAVSAAGDKTFVMEVGDAADAVLTYTEANGDGKNGCNLTGQASQVTFDVVQTGDAGITGLPATVTFPDCDTSVPLAFTASGAGTTTVTLSLSSLTTRDASTFDTSGATFVVTVVAPQEVDGRDAPAIANDYLHGHADVAFLEACRTNNGTNKNQSNWHGQLISNVAQYFEGRTFAPSEEHVVTDYVDSLC